MHTEGSESPEDEQSALSLPEEGVCVVRPVQFFVDLDPKGTYCMSPPPLPLPR